MTRLETLEFLPLITAYANGKIIQYKGLHSAPWEDISYPTWTDPVDSYRIKPEPREWVFYGHDDGDYLYHHKHTAELKPIRVREILD